MNQASQNQPVPQDCRVAFAMRPPSQSWEVLTIPTTPPRQIWCWFKPSHAPTALVLQFPTEGEQPEAGQTVTLRTLIRSAGLDPACVPMCSLFGFSFAGESGASAYFDQPVSAPAEAADPSVVVYVDPPPGDASHTIAAGQNAAAANASPAMDKQTKEMFNSLERDWRASTQAEKQLVGLHKQLLDMVMRLNTMNRDLTPDERLSTDREDRDDWQEARRFLREASTRLSRYIKEMDAGETIYAGKKQWYSDIYREFVAERQPFEGMAQVCQEFEIYRKTMQNLVTSMQGAYQHARSEGEQRAQIVLNRIAAKVSAARAGR